MIKYLEFLKMRLAVSRPLNTGISFPYSNRFSQMPGSYSNSLEYDVAEPTQKELPVSLNTMHSKYWHEWAMVIWSNKHAFQSIDRIARKVYCKSTSKIQLWCFQSSGSFSVINFNPHFESCIDIAPVYNPLASKYDMNLDSLAGSNTFSIYLLLAFA